MTSPASRAIDQRSREPGDSRAACKVRFSATLLSPRPSDVPKTRRCEAGRPCARAATWTFLILPKEASGKLPSRGQVSVEGAFNGRPFRATLEPDGRGGHWLKVDRKMREAAGTAAGDTVTLEIAPLAPSQEPEPGVPPDLRKALAAATAKAREVWADITPAARRDFIHWMTSGKKAETRVKRIATTCDMLAKGKRRPCCFDRSGMYSKSMSCPVAAAPL
ncbi:MAG: YdeI/OmpD-associated family protein [Phycisphaerales bacterium]